MWEKIFLKREDGKGNSSNKIAMHRPWYDRLHYSLISVTLLLVIYGLLMLFSATYAASGLSEVLRQLVYALIGIVLALYCMFIDYKLFSKAAVFIYIIVLVLLIAVMFVGSEALGAQRWLSLGPLGSFQPSEIAKLGLIITLSSYFSKVEQSISLKTFLLTGVHVGIPVLLILKQPDLGTALVLIAFTFGILFTIGYNPFLIASILISGGVVMMQLLNNYQRTRLLIFLDPNRDPQGGGWNIIQSIIAVGSGGLFGKGLLSGTQTQLKFVPEHHTDFIFTVLAEETGFVGGVILFLLYFLLLWFATRIALNAKDKLGKLLAAGISVMFLFHILVNVGMTMQIMPITGIPLPFISFGGSAMLTNFMAVGVLLSIHFRQDNLIP